MEQLAPALNGAHNQGDIMSTVKLSIPSQINESLDLADAMESVMDDVQSGYANEAEWDVSHWAGAHLSVSINHSVSIDDLMENAFAEALTDNDIIDDEARELAEESLEWDSFDGESMEFSFEGIKEIEVSAPLLRRAIDLAILHEPFVKDENGLERSPFAPLIFLKNSLPRY